MAGSAVPAGRPSITPEDQVPPEWAHYIDKNAAYYRARAPLTVGPRAMARPAPA